MRKFTAAAMMFGWVLCGGSAQADPLSGTQLKEKSQRHGVGAVQKRGAKTNRRLEVTLNRDGNRRIAHFAAQNQRFRSHGKSKGATCA